MKEKGEIVLDDTVPIWMKLIRLDLHDTTTSKVISINTLFNESIDQLRNNICERWESESLSPANISLIWNGATFENNKKLSDYLKGDIQEPLQVFLAKGIGDSRNNSNVTESQDKDTKTAITYTADHDSDDEYSQQQNLIHSVKKKCIFSTRTLILLSPAFFCFLFAALCTKANTNNDALITSSNGWTVDPNNNNDWCSYNYCTLYLFDASGEEHSWIVTSCDNIVDCLNDYGFTQSFSDSDLTESSTYLSNHEFTMWYTEPSNGKCWASYDDAVNAVGFVWACFAVLFYLAASSYIALICYVHLIYKYICNSEYCH